MIKFGVIGCGNVSQTYLYTLKENINSEVVAVVDVDRTRSKNNADLFSISSVYTDFREMFVKESLDAVVIATPHYLHYGQFMACIEKGLHILCEKPLATTLKETKEMVKAAASNKAKFSVMLQRRFFPNSAATRNAITKGVLGDIINVSLSFACHKSPDFYNCWRGKKINGGGVLISQALHRIDRLIYFFGEPQGVEGIIKTTRPDIEVEDYAKGKIYFTNNIVANIEANNSSGNPDTISLIRITGTKGNILLSDDKTIEWNVKGIPVPNEISINHIPIQYRPAYYGPCHEMIINDFVDSIINNREPFVPGEAALTCMKTVFAFYKAAEEKTKIRLSNNL